MFHYWNGLTITTALLALLHSRMAYKGGGINAHGDRVRQAIPEAYAVPPETLRAWQLYLSA